MIGKDWDERRYRVITQPLVQPFQRTARNVSVSETNKSYLPSKNCAACGHPFTWPKKWERCWDDAKYCSVRCRKDKPNAG